VDLFNHQKGKWPIKYLGTCVCARRLTIAELEFIEEKVKKSMGGWMGGTMSIGGILIKIDAYLSNIDVYQMSMRLLHKTNTENISRPIRAFF
jgi:pyocin large subunit-like protein